MGIVGGMEKGRGEEKRKIEQVRMDKIVKGAVNSRGQCWPTVMPSCVLDEKKKVTVGRAWGQYKKMRSLCWFRLLGCPLLCLLIPGQGCTPHCFYMVNSPCTALLSLSNSVGSGATQHSTLPYYHHSSCTLTEAAGDCDVCKAQWSLCSSPTALHFHRGRLMVTMKWSS